MFEAVHLLTSVRRSRGEQIKRNNFLKAIEWFITNTLTVIMSLPVDILFWFFLLLNSVTSAVTACNVDVFKKTWDNTYISFPHHRNQFQTSVTFSLCFKSWVDVVIGYINKVEKFLMVFLIFAINWIHWKVEMLENVNMKRNSKFYWYVKSFHLTIYWQVFVLYFKPTIFQNL